MFFLFTAPNRSSPKSGFQPINNEDSDDITNEVMLNDEVAIKQFVAVETLEEQGPVRAVAFHPSGECYAVGSNTKVLHYIMLHIFNCPVIIQL